MSWTQHIKHPSQVVSMGQMIDAVILSLDKDNKKLSLGIKQLEPDPWLNLMQKYPVGSRHKGVVRNLTNFGVFVELEQGVDGLVHISDLSWTKRFSHPSEFTKVGCPIEVVILEIDKENRKLSLGHKQIEENPWDTFENVFPVGSYHEATVIRRDDRGVIVQLPYGLEAFAPPYKYPRQIEFVTELPKTATGKIQRFKLREQEMSAVRPASTPNDPPSESGPARDGPAPGSREAVK